MLATLAELAKPLGPISNVDSTISPPSVFDILGRVVAGLVDDSLPAGLYEIPWKADNLPSGMHYYRLEAAPFVAGGFNSTRKMLLPK